MKGTRTLFSVVYLSRTALGDLVLVGVPSKSEMNPTLKRSNTYQSIGVWIYWGQRSGAFDSISGMMTLLGVPSPFFPGILPFRKPSTTQGKQPVFGKNDG